MPMRTSSRNCLPKAWRSTKRSVLLSWRAVCPHHVRHSLGRSAMHQQQQWLMHSRPGPFFLKMPGTNHLSRKRLVQDTGDMHHCSRTEPLRARKVVCTLRDGRKSRDNCTCNYYKNPGHIKSQTEFQQIRRGNLLWFDLSDKVDHFGGYAHPNSRDHHQIRRSTHYGGVNQFASRL